MSPNFKLKYHQIRLNDIIKPFKTRELHITGEAYSKRQAWIEGARNFRYRNTKILNSNR